MIRFEADDSCAGPAREHQEAEQPDVRPEVDDLRWAPQPAEEPGDGLGQVVVA
jgi:hypothetical protein